MMKNMCVDVEVQEKWERFYAKKAEQMPGLLEWCKDKAPEKNADEVYKWASKIFDRKYEWMKPEIR